MEEDITRLLREKEERHRDDNVTIIAARDYGSRTKGLAGPNSDYDVRFLFVQDREDYIGTSYHDTLHTSSGDVELEGWNLKKFRENLYGNGPMAVEFLTSDIVYYEHPDLHQDFDRLEQHVDRKFKPIALIMHYRSMATSQYRKYIRRSVHDGDGTSYPIQGESNAYWIVENGDGGSKMIRKNSQKYEEATKDRVVKRYLNVLWAVLCARYIEETHELPPRGYDVLTMECLERGLIDEETFLQAREFSHMKRAGDGDEYVGNPLKDYVEGELDRGIDHNQHVVRGVEKSVLDEFVSSVCSAT